MKLLAEDDGSVGGGAGTATEPPPSSPPAPAVSAPEGQPAPSLIQPTPPAEPLSAAPLGPLGDEWIAGDGSFRDGWYKRFPEEMQVSLAKYNNVEALANGLGNAQAFIGKKGIFLPTEKSTPQEVADFRKAVGVPETPEAYQIKPDILPEGMQWSDDLAKPFLAVAHKHNVSQAALKELSAAFAQMEAMKGQHAIASAQYQHDQKIANGTAKLQEIWKGDFERNRLKAQQAAALMGVPADDPGFLSPNVVAGVVRLANMISEDKLVGVTGGIQPSGNTLALARDVINNAQNPKHQLYHSGDPDIQHQVRQWIKEGTRKPGA